MLNAKFLKNKVNRQINQNGQLFVFVRYGEDDYHQVSDEPTEEIELRGIYHTSNSFVQVSTSDGASIKRKPQPMILCLYEEGKEIKENDTVVIGEDTYKVVDVNNINAFNAVIDISLEKTQWDQ